jgi:hypothetical protein
MHEHHLTLRGSALTLIMVMVGVSCIGCNGSAKKAQPTQTTPTSEHTDNYPPRPSTPPPAFKVFHQDGSTFTLVTKEDATDDEIVALIYELRDAAHTQGFNALHISQKAVDARDPYAWFHIYRGPKCAPEKYVPKPPCGASYHAAGDYTFGGLKRKDWDDGILIHGQDNETHLWDPDAPYKPTH